MKTTLNKIKSKNPCRDGWETLLKGLGKTKADDEPLDYLTIFETNGLADTLWCLDKVENKQRELRLFMVWCARRVQHLIPQNEQEKFEEVLAVVERYANGLITDTELAWVWASASASASAWAWASAKKEIENYFVREVLK